MGLVVKNAILIVDFTNQLKAEENTLKKPSNYSWEKGRMRPILMTTLSMVLGILPIAMAAGTTRPRMEKRPC